MGKLLYTQHGYTTLLLSSRNILCAFVRCFQTFKSSKLMFSMHVRDRINDAGLFIKQRGICLRVCPEWPAMHCMEWLPSLGIQGSLLRLKMIHLVLAASEVNWRPPEAGFFALF